MASSNEWVTRGFEAFRAGVFDNGGQNLYVSHAGVLQRIHDMDVNGDGHADLIICNSQNHWERPPCYVYLDPLGSGGRVELPSEGSVSATVADLNGDGVDDLVLAMDYNGSRQDLNAFVYYGSAEGLGEHRKIELPAPSATAVAAGDFDGDECADLAFVSSGKLRVFYQTELGFEIERYSDLDVAGGQLAAADLDGDGYSDLYVLSSADAVVYWGGPGGLAPERHLVVRTAHAALESRATGAVPDTEAVLAVSPLAKVIVLGGVPHLFAPTSDRALLFPVLPGRVVGEPLVFACPHTLSVAVGDVNGDGHPDLVFATRGHDGARECCWVYWGGAEGFREDQRAALASQNACDVALGDLTGNGCADVIICQDRLTDTFDFHSLICRATPEGLDAEPVLLEGHDARRVLIARTIPGEPPQVILVNHRARRSGGDIDVVVYYGGADGFDPKRCRPLQGRDAVDAVCCDVDDDGVPEIITANCSENAIELDPGSFLFRRGPEGHGYAPDLVFPTTRAHGVCCADLNHDGYLDLVFAGFDNPEILVFNGVPGGFDVERPARLDMTAADPTWKEPRFLYLADLNNDGWLDLVVPQIASQRSLILWGGPEGFSLDRRQELASWHVCSVQAADFTGNGYLDLVMGGHTPSLVGPHDSFVYVYWNGPEGLSDDRRTQLPANAVNAMAVADFDGDGNLDLFVANYHDGRVRDIDSHIYWGLPGGRLSAERRTRFFMHSASGAVAADFNEDGWVDLAVAYHKVNNDHLGHSAVWWNGPEGFSEQRTTLLPSMGPHGMTRSGTGNQRDRGPEEYYVSPPYELPPGARLRSIAWRATTPPKTWVRAQVRAAASRHGLTDACWTGPAGEGSWYECDGTIGAELPAGPWVQYRLALGATNGCGTPRVTEVRLTWA